MKIEMSTSVSDRECTTAGELKKFLENIPDEARLWISTHSGDYNQMDYHTLDFDWNVSK